MISGYNMYKYLLPDMMLYASRVHSKQRDDDKDFILYVICKTIIKAICDLHHGNLTTQSDARTYFNSDKFVKHCKALGMEFSRVMHIVEQPESYLEKVEKLKKEYAFESTI